RLLDRALPASADPDRGRCSGPREASLSLCARLQARAQNRAEQLVRADRDAVSGFAVRALAALSQALPREVVATVEAAAEIAATGLRDRLEPAAEPSRGRRSESEVSCVPCSDEPTASVLTGTSLPDRHFPIRRRGRVAEGGGLLNRYTLQRRIE